MQKAFIAIAFALTLASVASLTTPDGTWVKTLVPVVENTDLNYTNKSASLGLGPITSTTDLNLYSYFTPVCDKNGDTVNELSCAYGLNFKPIATKDLSSSKNTSYGFKAGDGSQFTNGYAVSAMIGNDSNKVPQLFIAQTKLEGGAILPQVFLTTNTDVYTTPMPLGGAASPKQTMMFIHYNETTNFTSFTVGGSSAGKQFKWTGVNATKIGSIAAAWGEALSTSQVYAGYVEDKTYKVAVVDFGSGTQIGAATLGGYDEKMSCQPYVTDKKLYGVFCTNTTYDDKGNRNTTLYASSANTTLYPIYTIVNSSGISVKPFPYAGYLGLLTTNANQANATTISKEAWDLEGNKGFINKTAFVTYDATKEKVLPYRIPGAGYYALTFTQNGTSDRSDVKVGQFMAGSSLTTVFAFLMTIVAGLFLF